MSTIMHDNELLRRACAYIEEKRRENPELSLSQIMDEAGMRFNLNPMVSQALERLFRDECPNIKPEDSEKA